MGRPEPPSKPPRILALDAARAVAVLAMVVGHTLHAVLTDVARATPAMSTYWEVRRFTAPLFLLVSGWAVMTAAARLPRGLAPWRRFARRVALLFGLGFLLQWPAGRWPALWSFAREPWEFVLSAGPLTCIAGSMVVMLAIASFTDRPGVRAAALVAATATAVFAAEPTWATLAHPAAPLLAKQWLGGGTSLFPMLPWAGYFFMGGVIALGIGRVDRREHRVIALLGAGALALLPLGHAPAAGEAVTSPALFAWRLGPCLLIAAVLFVVPARVLRPLAPVGQASLWAYVIHLPMVYGWGYVPGLSGRIGRSLEAGHALGLAALVLAVTLPTALIGRRLWLRGRRRTAGHAVEFDRREAGVPNQVGVVKT